MWNSKFQIKNVICVHTQKLMLSVIIGTVTKADLWSMSAETVCTAACLVNASLQQRSVHRSMTPYSLSSVLRKSHVLWKLKRNAIKVEPPETPGEWEEQQKSQNPM